MAQAGDSFIIHLGNTHLDWGRHRYTDSRDPIRHEGYLPIPAHIARRFNIMNSNATDGNDVLGSNLFYCQSTDGYLDGILKAQGCSSKGAFHAKNFSMQGNLKAIGNWLELMDSRVGDSVQLTWTSSTEIIVELIKN